MVQFPVWHETSSSSSFSITVAVSPPIFAESYPAHWRFHRGFPVLLCSLPRRHIVTNIPFFRDRCGHRHRRRRRRRESKHVKGFGTRESVVSPLSLPTLAWLFFPRRRCPYRGFPSCIPYLKRRTSDARLPSYGQREREKIYKLVKVLCRSQSSGMWVSKISQQIGRPPAPLTARSPDWLLASAAWTHSSVPPLFFPVHNSCPARHAPQLGPRKKRNVFRFSSIIISFSPYYFLGGKKVRALLPAGAGTVFDSSPPLRERLILGFGPLSLSRRQCDTYSENWPPPPSPYRLAALFLLPRLSRKRLMSKCGREEEEREEELLCALLLCVRPIYRQGRRDSTNIGEKILL